MGSPEPIFMMMPSPPSTVFRSSSVCIKLPGNSNCVGVVSSLSASVLVDVAAVVAAAGSFGPVVDEVVEVVGETGVVDRMVLLGLVHELVLVLRAVLVLE